VFGFEGEGHLTCGNAIAVHPTNPYNVLCRGVDLHRSTKGGSTWTQVTHWDLNWGQA
jgi:hypothetical protein